MTSQPAPVLKAPTELQWDDRLPVKERAAFATWNACIARLNEERAVEVNISGPFLKSKIAWKLATYQHALLHRVVALADGVAVNWNGRSVLGAMLCARALMETIAVLSFVERSAAARYEQEDLGDLDALGQNGTFATRDEALLKEFPESTATNILTYVRRFDEKVLPGFSEHYDRLSERCHPNAPGHYFMFAKLNRDEGRTSYSDHAAPQRHAGLILAALAVIPLVESMNARMNASVMKVADLQNRLAPVPDDAQSDGAE